MEEKASYIYSSTFNSVSGHLQCNYWFFKCMSYLLGVYGNQTWPIKWNAVSSRQLSCQYCTTGTLTKQLEKKLRDNYTRMLRAILNKSWWQYPQATNYTATCLPSRKLYKLDESDTQGHWWRSKDELISDVLLRTPHIAEQKQDDQLEHTYSRSVRIRDVALKTCRRPCIIGRSGEWGSRCKLQEMMIYIYIWLVHSVRSAVKVSY